MRLVQASHAACMSECLHVISALRLRALVEILTQGCLCCPALLVYVLKTGKATKQHGICMLLVRWLPNSSTRMRRSWLRRARLGPRLRQHRVAGGGAGGRGRPRVSGHGGPCV